jgi:hypothetical protein
MSALSVPQQRPHSFSYWGRLGGYTRARGKEAAINAVHADSVVKHSAALDVLEAAVCTGLSIKEMRRLIDVALRLLRSSV